LSLRREIRIQPAILGQDVQRFSATAPIGLAHKSDTALFHERNASSGWVMPYQ